MSIKLYNVFGTIGRLDRNYHVLADSNMEARKMIRKHDTELSIKSVTQETKKTFEELYGADGSFQQAWNETEESGGIDLYDEGT